MLKWTVEIAIVFSRIILSVKRNCLQNCTITWNSSLAISWDELRRCRLLMRNFQSHKIGKEIHYTLVLIISTWNDSCLGNRSNNKRNQFLFLDGLFFNEQIESVIGDQTSLYYLKIRLRVQVWIKWEVHKHKIIHRGDSRLLRVIIHCLTAQVSWCLTGWRSTSNS